ncbi:MAG: deoxyguanosinetriphosphate triphosphohydrolase, partial [Alphaproteobacteria bacterium]|nr:deoxyguanosinetriphosphate triphosphohydrolase [Alphaproteobacteria bacterium]
RNPDCLPLEWYRIIKNNQSDTPENVKARLIADYIAGMTDRYAVTAYQRAFSMEKFV